jgi:hypothetical protein
MGKMYLRLTQTRVSLLIWVFTLFLIFAYSASSGRAAELVTNGGFETGTFAPWTAVNVTTNVWYNWRITAANCDACLDQWTSGGSSPHTGTRSAWNGWAAGNPVPDAYRMRQDITIPNNSGELVRLRWWDRLQWNLAYQAGSVLPQYMIVNILNPANNAVIQEMYRFTAPAASQGPTTPPGVPWVQHIADLSAYKGQTVRLEFMCTVAQNTMGPGICEFDDISVQNFTPTAANVQVGGRVVTAGGAGIAKTLVSMTGAGGDTRTTLTNVFGYYSFDEVAVGQSYVVSVSNKRYQFSNPTRIVTVEDTLTDLDFTALP